MDAVARWLTTLRARISNRTLSRVASLPLALGTGTVLVLAAWLEPSPLGHSTHTQLGLGSCTFLTLTGWPCPMCGATTTFALMAHFHPIQAFLNQPFAACLFLATVGVFAVSAAELIAPRERWPRILDRTAPWEGVIAGGFLIAMCLGWLYKMAIMGRAV